METPENQGVAGMQACRWQRRGRRVVVVSSLDTVPRTWVSSRLFCLLCTQPMYFKYIFLQIIKNCICWL